MNNLIPREFIDELLHKIDIVDLIDAYVPLKKRGQSHLACCPFHQEKTPSFNVIAKKQFYHCFGCGASGNALSFLMQYLHQSFPQAVETLANKLGLTIPRQQGAERFKASASMHQLLQKVTNFYQQNLRSPAAATAVEYLKQRGVSGEIAKRYQMGYAPEGWQCLEQQFHKEKELLRATGMLVEKENGKTYDRYRHRIIFPIQDRQGRIIGFGGRAIEASQQPKYLNSPETSLFQKGKELYGLFQAIQQPSKPSSIIVVEGYLDVIALAQNGINHVVATLGTATSAYHIQLLGKYTQEIIFCFDGDKAGRQAAWRALESSLNYLDGNLNARFVWLTEGHDPDSYIRLYGRGGFEELLSKAEPWHKFFFDTLLSKTDIQDLNGKSQLIHSAKPYLAKMQQGATRALLIEELARLTRIESQRIEQLVLEDSPLIKAEEPPERQSLARTPLNIAIALLLQEPEIIHPLLKDIGNPAHLKEDYPLLAELIQRLSAMPKMQTASAVEYYRETKEFDIMNQLATWDHQVPTALIASEWLARLKFMAKKSQDQQIELLLKKSRQGLLSAEERYLLQERLQARHQTQAPD